MYGYQMVNEILHKSDNQYEPKEATLYSSFRRMEKNNLIRSYWGDDSSMGGRRKYYAITDEGKSVLKRLCDEWRFAKGVIDKFVEEV
jgi:PadR family transcriptional regulator PadR